MIKRLVQLLLHIVDYQTLFSYVFFQLCNWLKRSQHPFTWWDYRSTRSREEQWLWCDGSTSPQSLSASRPRTARWRATSRRPAPPCSTTKPSRYLVVLELLILTSEFLHNQLKVVSCRVHNMHKGSHTQRRQYLPAMLDIPQPRLVPQYDDSVDECRGVVEPAPARLAELHQRCRFTCTHASSSFETILMFHLFLLCPYFLSPLS